MQTIQLKPGINTKMEKQMVMHIDEDTGDVIIGVVVSYNDKTGETVIDIDDEYTKLIQSKKL